MGVLIFGCPSDLSAEVELVRSGGRALGLQERLASEQLKAAARRLCKRENAHPLT